MYFNSGVMVIDMQSWRELEVGKQVMDLLVGDLPTRSVDQDALNAVLWDRFVPLEPEWNAAGRWVSTDAGKARIVHFVGDEKPWRVGSPVSLFQREYVRLAKEVGWSIDPTRSWNARRIVRATLPVGLLERIRWRYPRH